MHVEVHRHECVYVFVGWGNAGMCVRVGIQSQGNVCMCLLGGSMQECVNVFVDFFCEVGIMRASVCIVLVIKM